VGYFTVWAKCGLMLALTIAIHSCTGQMAASPAARMPHDVGQVKVGHGLHDRFMRDPPTCVIILPARLPRGTEIRAIDLEVSVERFLTVQFDRVLAGSYRDRQARHLALDLNRPEDLAIFAARTRCHHALSITMDGGKLSYAVIWAERRVGLHLRLTRVGAFDEVLWWPRDVGVRGDGGLPLSPFGAAGALFRAGRVAEDHRQGLSLLDDVLRRMMRSLPDVRDPGYSMAHSTQLSMNSIVKPSGSRKLATQ
jgi:hypothetical protein